MELLVSVHDVMPDTLSRVESMVARLDAAALGPALLLVVPGKSWSAVQLDRLCELAARGHQLAGHGWSHEVWGFRNLYHRVHGALLSRRAAEHLALEPAAITALVRACRGWFDEHRLPAPVCYVPPAWAMGALRREELADLGFRYYETLGGIYDARARHMHRLPLLGFEADTRARQLALRASNRLNALLGGRSGRARLAIHPDDDRLLLAADLGRWLGAGLRAAGLDSLGTAAG